MRILFEEHQYEPRYLGRILKDVTGIEQEIIDKKVSLGYVGYFFCPEVNDCVFILPKVLLTDDKVLGCEVLAHIKKKNGSAVLPEDIVSPEGQNEYLTPDYKKFIYEFSVWVYRSLAMYKKLNPKESSIYQKQLPEEGRGHKHEARTYLDIILSMIRFNRENQDFFMFIVKNMHAGMNKINWTRTISKSQAIMQEGSPLYLKPVNKKRQINFDEELLVIFFSVLNYLNEQYGFKTPINCQYELVTGNRFESLRKGQGRKRLLSIKYKYFSDKALQLWDLCYAFFNSSHRICVNTEQKEYLLAKSFEHVFEAMIDELIGAPRQDIPAGLKDQLDGKRVDHMYAYDALTRYDEKQNDQIYYIGDSKYYKSGHPLGRESIYKQYTYARNVIQWNVDLFMDKPAGDWSEEEVTAWNSDKERFKNIRLRKDTTVGNVTEGYDVIPNFFLSAYVEEDHAYNDHNENIRLHKNTKDEHSTYISYQFPNRLFDRDTNILSHYDVNFLYVLYLYARNKASEKKVWKMRVRDIFRDEIRGVLEKKYDFYALKPKTSQMDREYIRTHFQDVLGKIYTPFGVEDMYSLALNNAEEYKKENEELLKQLDEVFVYDKIKGLGKVPDSVAGYVPVVKKEVAAIDKNEKNVLIVYIDKAMYDKISRKEVKRFIVKSIPSGNILAVKYLMPWPAIGVNQYYNITGLSFGEGTTEDGMTETHLNIQFDYDTLTNIWHSPKTLPFRPQTKIASFAEIEKWTNKKDSSTQVSMKSQLTPDTIVEEKPEEDEFD